MTDPARTNRATALLGKLRTGRSNDAMWSGIGTLAGAFLILGSLAILTIVLSLEELGVYTGVASAGSVLLGFAVFGSPEAMLLALPRSSDVAATWGRALGTTILAAGVCFAVIMGATRFILPDVSPGLIAALVAGDYVIGGSASVNTQLMRGLGNFKSAAVLSIVTAAMRLVASALLFLFDDRSLERYAVINLVLAVVAAVGITTYLGRIVGAPRLSIPRSIVDYRQGAAIATGQTSTAVSAGADQTLLLRAGFVADNGLYGIGVRIVNYAMLPVGAVMATTYPEFFAKGTEGIEATIAFAKKVARPMLAYGVGILIPLWVGAAVLEWLMGEKYDGLAVVIWAMSGFPLLRILQVLIGDSLKGVGHFGEASIAILLTALLNVGLNLVLIPDYSWKGAAAATYIAEIVYLLLLLAALRRVRRTSRRLDPISTHGTGAA